MAEEPYLRLNGEPLEDARALLEQGDYPQTSEKLWGAAEAVKAVAAARGWRHSSHRDLRSVISRLPQETGDRDLSVLFSVAESLHANCYEDFMASQDVLEYAELISSDREAAPAF
jgi:HEPN domain-containing protein